MTKWKKSLLITAPAVALAFVAGLWMTPSTIAQIRAALVRDVDHPAQAPVRFVASVSVAAGQTFGAANLAPVPAGKRLVIQTVSVFGYTQTPERIVAVWLSTNPESTYISLDPQTTELKSMGSFFSGYDAIAYNRNVTFVYEPGEIPRLIVGVGSTTNPKFVNFFIHGYYVTL
jgi:hypothetical protein